MLRTVNKNKVGWQDINDVEIGQNINYELLSNVPNMNGYDTYYFAFHDTMDKAFTFDKDSVSVEIYGKDGNLEKSYFLKPEEFSVKTNVGEETFVIEITDLKAIVDREYSKGIDSHKHNEYGQDIRVRYNAKLNDEARFEHVQI